MQAFNGWMIFPYGYIELMITVAVGRTVTRIESQFFRVPCKIVYSCILGNTHHGNLICSRFWVHFKLKFHNINGEPVTVNVNLSRAKKYIISLAVRPERRGKSMEIEVISLTSQLKDMNIFPHTGKICHFSQTNNSGYSRKLGDE